MKGNKLFNRSNNLGDSKNFKNNKRENNKKNNNNNNNNNRFKK